MFKKCRKCKEIKSVKDFYWDKAHNNYTPRCRKCHPAKNHAQSMKKYASTEKGRQAVNEAGKRAYRNHPEKMRSRSKLRIAVEKGLIKKPKYCTDCRERKEEKLLQGHHEDYSKPLEVVWLCARCHAKADKLLEQRSHYQIT